MKLKDYWNKKYWHLGYIVAIIKRIGKNLPMEKSPKKRAILKMKREVLAIKKHIVFMNEIIQRYEEENE